MQTGCNGCADAVTGLTTIDITATADPQVLNVGDVLIGRRADSKLMADHIRKNYRKVGEGICRSKQKLCYIYVNHNEANTFYGLSSILPDRYFTLAKGGA